MTFWYALRDEHPRRDLLTLLLALCGTDASAGLFTPKTMQGDWPERQVDRAWVLPKGWTEVGVAYEHKVSRAGWDVTGERVAWRHATRFDHSRFWLRVEHGISRRVRAYVHVPVWVVSRLRNDLGADTATGGLGDARAGLFVQPWLAEQWHVAYRVELKAPSGVEWPGDLVGGPDQTTGFLLGTGITNVGISAHHRVSPGRWFSADLSLGWVFKLPAVVGWVLEDDGFGNGWFDPGDELWTRCTLGVQLSDQLAIFGDLDVSYRGSHRIGVSGEGAFRTNLSRMEGTAGTWVQATGRVSWEPFDHLEVQASAGGVLHGGDTTMLGHLGLEELTPQAGWTLGGKITGRW